MKPAIMPQGARLSDIPGSESPKSDNRTELLLKITITARNKPPGTDRRAAVVDARRADSSRK
ncbi:hypothetical protein [Pseudomonas sp.]|uniref:hypothetical protein n=1 Tax=Pseudomonas sp. TaxID=306 RepID=UPI002357628D|nr:hypothetical protein [Pseudomonas sp.]